MDRQIFVYVDLDNSPRLVGRLRLRVRNRTESATFQLSPGFMVDASAALPWCSADEATP